MVSRKRPITKSTLYLKATIKVAIVVAAIVFAFLSIVMFTTSPEGIIVSDFIPIVGMTLVGVAICALQPLRALWCLRQQERFLGFSFNEEMKQYHINQLPHNSGNWFIVVEGYKIIAFRKDFIDRFGDYREIHELFYGVTAKEVILVCTDGKNRVLQVSAKSQLISDLRGWHEKQKRRG